MATLALVLAASAPSPAAAQTEPRVIAGNDAAPGDHPHQVFLKLGQFVCGGSILDSRHIVTAAHCAVNEQSFYPRVVASSQVSFLHGGVDLDVDGDGPDITDLKEGPQVQTVSVDRRYLREGASSNAYDSAMLTLATSLTLDANTNTNTNAIPLASPAEVSSAFTPGVKGTVSGWGFTVENDPNSASEILQEAEVPLVSDAQCQAIYPNRIVDAAMICAGSSSATPTQDTCQGDSGGPLSVTTSDGLKLAGITSFGDGCGRLPGVYTEVNEPATRTFLEDDTQVAPPSTTEAPTVSGTPRVGQQVTCSPPAVAGAVVSQHLWYAVNDTTASRLAPTTKTITLPSSSQGSRVICDARFENDGGFFYAEGDFGNALGPVAAAQAPSGGGGGGSPPPAPALLSDIGFGGFPRGAGLRRTLRRGLVGRIACDADCSFRASLVLPRRSARRAGLRGRTVVVSRLRSSDAGGGSGRRVRFRFKPSVARRLRRLTRGTALEVRVSAVDSRGSRRTEKKKLRLRR